MSVLLTSVFLTPAAQGEDRSVSINGFGGWSYGDTDGNRYLNGTDGGEYENVNFSLAVSSAPTDKLRISGQIELASNPIEEDEDVEVEIDYAFAEWAFSDTLHARVGRAKHPFGIYTEYYDVGTLRPFYDLPQGLYGPTGIAGESYDGIGITTWHSIGGGWNLTADAYLGSLRFESFEPWEGLEEEDEDQEAGDDVFEELFEDKHRDEVVGFRLRFESPIEGLSWGVSAYTGVVPASEAGERGGDDDDEDDGAEEADDDDAEDRRDTGYGVHLEYALGPWNLAAELARVDEEEELVADSFYVELAYMLDEHWQLAARYDWNEIDVEEVDISSVPSLGEHADLAVGVNYWFSREMVVKLSVHRVEGNRFAIAEAADEAVDQGLLEEETTLVSFGAQFAF